MPTRAEVEELHPEPRTVLEAVGDVLLELGLAGVTLGEAEQVRENDRPVLGEFEQLVDLSFLRIDGHAGAFLLWDRAERVSSRARRVLLGFEGGVDRQL